MLEHRLRCEFKDVLEPLYLTEAKRTYVKWHTNLHHVTLKTQKHFLLIQSLQSPSRVRLPVGYH